MHIRTRMYMYIYIYIYIKQKWAKMWEVGLWGSKNVGSGTMGV